MQRTRGKRKVPAGSIGGRLCARAALRAATGVPQVPVRGSQNAAARQPRQPGRHGADRAAQRYDVQRGGELQREERVQ